MLYIILFVAYFCLFSCLFHSSESHQISENIPTPIMNEQPDFYTQVSQLMSDDTEPLPTPNNISFVPENITTPTPLSYKELQKIPMEVLKTIASEMNIQFNGNKSQVCSRLKNRVTIEHLAKFPKFQIA